MSALHIEHLPCPECKGERLVKYDDGVNTCSSCSGRGHIWPAPYDQDAPDVSLKTRLGAVFALDLLRLMAKEVPNQLHFSDQAAFTLLFEATSRKIRENF